MKFYRFAFIFLIGTCILGQQSGSQHRLAASLQRKLDYIKQNGELAHPNPAPTVMTEEEINDYMASGRVKLPQGVKKVTFSGETGVMTGVAMIDFDEIRAGQHLSNPLLSLFNGTQAVRVEADAAGSGGKAKVHVRTVSINGINVPRFALEIFINKFLKPKYPNVGMDSEFQLTDRIDTATIGYHKLTVVQR
jgi:hypothetical protein